MIKELDIVALTVDFPESKLKAGDIGTVVDTSESGEYFQVEVMTIGGYTVDIISVHRSQIRPIGEREVKQARPLD